MFRFLIKNSVGLREIAKRFSLLRTNAIFHVLSSDVFSLICKTLIEQLIFFLKNAHSFAEHANRKTNFLFHRNKLISQFTSQYN